jgi:hypothetical protein
MAPLPKNKNVQIVIHLILSIRKAALPVRIAALPNVDRIALVRLDKKGLSEYPKDLFVFVNFNHNAAPLEL